MPKEMRGAVDDLGKVLRQLIDIFLTEPRKSGLLRPNGVLALIRPEIETWLASEAYFTTSLLGQTLNQSSLNFKHKRSVDHVKNKKSEIKSILIRDLTHIVHLIDTHLPHQTQSVSPVSDPALDKIVNFFRIERKWGVIKSKRTGWFRRREKPVVEGPVFKRCGQGKLPHDLPRHDEEDLWRRERLIAKAVQDIAACYRPYNAKRMASGEVKKLAVLAMPLWRAALIRKVNEILKAKAFTRFDVPAHLYAGTIRTQSKAPPLGLTALTRYNHQYLDLIHHVFQARNIAINDDIADRAAPGATGPAIYNSYFLQGRRLGERWHIHFFCGAALVWPELDHGQRMLRFLYMQAPPNRGEAIQYDGYMFRTQDKCYVVGFRADLEPRDTMQFMTLDGLNRGTPVPGHYQALSGWHSSFETFEVKPGTDGMVSTRIHMVLNDAETQKAGELRGYWEDARKTDPVPAPPDFTQALRGLTKCVAFESSANKLVGSYRILGDDTPYPFLSVQERYAIRELVRHPQAGLEQELSWI